MSYREERRELVLRRAESLALAGRGAEAARDYLDARRPTRSNDDRFQHRRAAAEQLLVSGHINEGLELLRECMSAVGERLPSSSYEHAARADREHDLAAHPRHAYSRAARRTAARRQTKLRLDLYRTASLGLSLVDAVPGALCQARALRTALQLGDRRRIAYALAYHAMYSAAAGEAAHQVRAPLVAQSRQIAESERDPFLLGWARCGEGVVEYFAGHFELAVDVLIDAETQLREFIVGNVPELNHLRLFVMFALRRHGTFDRLRAHYLEYVRDATRRGDRYARHVVPLGGERGVARRR